MTQPGKAVQCTDELRFLARRGQIEWRFQRGMKAVRSGLGGQAIPKFGFGTEDGWALNATTRVAVVAQDGAAKSEECGFRWWNEINRITRQFGHSVSGWW